jgi:hypothetical protein
VVTLGAIWLALLRPPMGVWIAIVAAIAGAILWVVLGAQAWRRIANPERHRLRLDREGLLLVDGERERRIAWDAVEAVETEEERLRVRLDVRDEEPLRLEPRYGGLGAYELERAVTSAWRAARASEGEREAPGSAPRSDPPDGRRRP